MDETKKLPKPALVALLVALGASVPYLHPALARLRLVSAADVSRTLGAFRGVPRVPLLRRNEIPPPLPSQEATGAPPPAAHVESRAVAEGPRGPVPASPGTPIEDPAGDLSRFFAALDRVEKGESGALARISHYGDSPLTGDMISGEARSMLQKQFGNGGPGFVLAGRPWGWYGHRGIALDAKGWTPHSPLLTWGNGGHYGLGLVSFSSASAGARSDVAWEKGRFTRAEVTFTVAPGNGTLLVSVDGGAEEAVPTAGAERRTARFVAAAPEGAARIALRPKGDGEVTVYGVTLETAGPGLVYDALGANGSSVHALALADAKGWIDSLALRGSDLVILNYGTNESGNEAIAGPHYVRELVGLVGRVRTALPEASVLIMAPMDRGARGPEGEITTMPAIPKIVEAQRKAAQEARCAFFDTYAAMGGDGTMARWYRSEPRLVTGDFTHTTFAGSERVARLLVDALLGARAARGGPPPAAGAPAGTDAPTAPAAPAPTAPAGDAGSSLPASAAERPPG
ncbi:MAG: GDSL-type esterase/lipase family protein [Thermoanaerobaculia bacterium]